MAVGSILASAALAQAGSSGQGAVQASYSGLNTGLKHVLKSVHAQWAGGAGRTLVTASNDLRVEPIVLLDERVYRLSYVNSILEAMQRLFSTYYLLSVAAENTIGAVTIQKRIGKFSPDRDLNAATAEYLSVESYQFGLPFANRVNGFDRYALYSAEANHPHVELSNENGKGGSDLSKQATEIGSLSIGQIINVNIVDGNNSANVPIQIRLRIIGSSPAGMVNILGLGAEDESRSTRIRKFRVGELGLKDLITNQDIIDRYRRASYADKTGYFRKAHSQKNKGLLATFLTGEPSIGAISSLAIVSRQTIDELQREHHVKLDDYESRQEIFKQSLFMILAVVDDDTSTVTIYTRDIDSSQQYWVKDLEKAYKRKDDDLTDLMKSFMAGQIPGRL